jgi:hypothetical protein
MRTAGDGTLLVSDRKAQVWLEINTVHLTRSMLEEKQLNNQVLQRNLEITYQLQ